MKEGKRKRSRLAKRLEKKEERRKMNKTRKRKEVWEWERRNKKKGRQKENGRYTKMRVSWKIRKMKKREKMTKEAKRRRGISKEAEKQQILAERNEREKSTGRVREKEGGRESWKKGWINSNIRESESKLHSFLPPMPLRVSCSWEWGEWWAEAGWARQHPCYTPTPVHFQELSEPWLCRCVSGRAVRGRGKGRTWGE